MPLEFLGWGLGVYLVCFLGFFWGIFLFQRGKFGNSGGEFSRRKRGFGSSQDGGTGNGILDLGWNSWNSPGLGQNLWNSRGLGWNFPGLERNSWNSHGPGTEFVEFSWTWNGLFLDLGMEFVEFSWIWDGVIMEFSWTGTEFMEFSWIWEWIFPGFGMEFSWVGNGIPGTFPGIFLAFSQIRDGICPDLGWNP